MQAQAPYIQPMDPREPLITRYRPTKFDMVAGNEAAIKALARRVGEPGRPHVYLFTGPSGVGKTTLARIVGITFDAEVIEVDAASNNGVDAMRAIVELGQHMALGFACRLIILDECHMLSRAAWNAALKVLEDPPSHLFIALCTTELGKVPETVFTRCHHVKLDPLSDLELSDLLGEVIFNEKWHDTVRQDVFPLIVAEAHGSARRGLTLLQALYDAPSLDEAKRIIVLQGNDNPLIMVLRALIEGQQGWDLIRARLVKLNDDEFSDASLTHACRYVIGAMQREMNEKKAVRLWELLSSLLCPVHSFDAKAVFYAAVGRFLWSAT